MKVISYQTVPSIKISISLSYSSPAVLFKILSILKIGRYLADRIALEREILFDCSFYVTYEPVHGLKVSTPSSKAMRLAN